ncbi:MAG: ABC transporter permease [Thermoproteota archaeon]
MSLETEVKKIWYMILTNFWTQALFVVGILMELIGITIGAGSYFFLTKVFQGTATIMEKYNTDVVSFIIIGLALNSMLSQSFIGFYNSLAVSYFNRSLERVLISPTSIYTLFFSQMISAYLFGSVRAILYLVIGALFFGLNISLRITNVVLAALIFLLGLVATNGLGMLLSSFFFYTHKGKGAANPIIMLAHTFADTFSGATFPVEILAKYASWLYPISIFLPQTHTISIVRVVLAGQGLSNPSVLVSVFYLIVFSVVIIPVGYLIISRGIDRIRKDGYAVTGGVVVY